MLQEKCTKDMNSILKATLARSFISEFASRLNVNIKADEEMEGGGNQQKQEPTEKSNAQATQGGDPGRNIPTAKSSTKPPTKPSDGGAPSANPMTNLAASLKASKKPSVVNSEFNVTGGMQNFDAGSQKSGIKKSATIVGGGSASQSKPPPQAFNTSNATEFNRQVKQLAKVTPEDILMHKRQKHGQLRIGDVILIAFHEEVHYAQLNEERYANAMQSLQENLGSQQQKPAAKKLRSLERPDFRYKGILFSNGITNQGINVIPQANHMSQNASNLYKQCLFRVEIKQDCEVNKKVQELKLQKIELDSQLRKMIHDSGGEDQMNQSKLQEIKKEITMIEYDIEENEKKRLVQEENNKYEQKLQLGTKLTYGQPIQLYHLFSGKYLTLNLQEMSQEYGCCQMTLAETSEQSWFTFQPAQSIYDSGQVVNFNDYFHIQSLITSTPFYLHVFRKPQDNIDNLKSFQLNAGQEPSPMKAKLFMNFDTSEQEKKFLQSGDVVRLKHIESNGYFTTTAMQVDQILPAYPDFLLAQIRRMERGETIERPKGGKDKQEMTLQEKQEMKNDEEFGKIYAEDISDEYTKILKSRLQEGVYVEQVKERLYFTNSCWEIQRVNPLKGGNMIQEEYYRFRHIGTGKYLAVADDRQELILRNTATSVTTLFQLKSDMSTKNPDKFQELDADHDGHIDESKLINSQSRIMIQSYIEDNYLQLYEDVDSEDLAQFSNKVHHINDPFLSSDQSKGSQYRVINYDYQNKEKQRMLFSIEEIQPQDAVYSYQANCIFDELLEFFSFINIWGVKPIELEETVEKFYYDNDKGIDDSDFLYERCEKVLYILNNLLGLIQNVEGSEIQLEKCKKELVEQGILDMICRCIELIYYKMTPPSLFMKSYQTVNQMNLKNKENRNPDEQQEGIDIKKIRIDDYIVQEIFRDNVEPVMSKMFEIVLILIRANRENSERITKYFGILFQHFSVHEAFIQLSLLHQSFHSEQSPKYISLIGDIFRRAQKNSMFVFFDRSSNALIEYNKRLTKFELDMKVKQEMHRKKNIVKQGQPQMMGIDSKTANENIERSSELNQVHKWLDLLEPVKFVDKHNQNLEKQIMYMNVISMFCRDKEGRGVYPYQLQVTQHLFSRDEHIPLKFGTARVGQVLRPFVYFVRPKALMSLSDFITNNPILGEIQDNFNMQQRSQNQYELIFDMHELTKNYETKGKETWPYIDYICAVINMYAHICLSANLRAIKALKDTGIDEGFILCTINQDTERLVLHEKFKQAFMFLTRTMFIQNDPISPGISCKNRCYVWERLKPMAKDSGNEDDEIYNENSQDEMFNIENDFYAGKEHKKKTQMDDPNNSMIVLRYEQDSKDLELIRMIKKQVIWFLINGPQGTDSFFYHHHRRRFIRQSLKIKVRSLKIYLETLYSLIAEDCVDPQFIDEVKFICQCAIMGATHLSEDQEIQMPVTVKSNWVYILMWIAKDITLTQTETRQMKNAVRAVEVKVLNILEKITSYRLNLQMHKFLFLFRRFQEQNLFPHIASDRSIDLHIQFQNLFNIHQFDNEFKMSDELLQKKVAESEESPAEVPLKKSKEAEVGNYDLGEGDEQLVNRKVPFDIYLMRFIFNNESAYEVRLKALQVLIKNFNQRTLLVKELARTDIIVSQDDYKVYFDFLQKQRQLKQLINKLVQDEMFHMIYKKSPSMETKNTKNDIINILQTIINTLEQCDPLQKRKLQNMLRHINIIDDLVNVLLRRLIFKENYYKELFQQVVQFLFTITHENPNCQRHLLPDLNFFLDLMNFGIETGPLIAEVIKSNTDPEYSKGFIRYIVNKIVHQNLFTSSLIKQLIRLAENAENHEIDGEESIQDGAGYSPIPPSQSVENSNQQYILKQIIKNQRFRTLLFMKKKYQQRKLAIIKTYAKKKEQYNISKKEDDAQIMFDKEQIDVHIAVVDLVAACSKNSAFGVAQAQKLIECEELLDSLLSDSIPFVIKKHYFSLLFEVYLRKVPGLTEAHRLKISDLKFAQVMKWVVQYDLEHSYNFFKGLIIDPEPQDTPDKTRKLKQITREVERIAEAEYDEKNMGKTEKDKDDERRFKAQLSSMADGQPFFVLDTSDLSEFWRYLFQYNKKEKTFDGLLMFIEQFYKDYSVAELNDENIQQISVKIRERLLVMVNKIYSFWEAHEGYIRPSVFDLMQQINRAVVRIPQMRAFRVGKRRVIKDGIITEVDENQGERADDSLNLDESRDLDNRMCGEKILRLLRDYIIQQNTHIKVALGINSITSDVMVDRDMLKSKIKAIVGSQALYDEIMKALDHFHKVSFQKRQERQVMNVEPGQEGYILNRHEASGNKQDEVLENKINFRDVEIQIKDVLKKAGYKPPNQQRERGGAENEMLVQRISDKDLSIAINMDLKLFVQRFFEFVHLTSNVAEMHDFVNKLMNSEFIADRDAKIQLISNLMNCFTGLEGVEDELILISVLDIILQRLIPDDEEMYSDQDQSSRKVRQWKKKNQKLKRDLKEWQEIMFECGVPELMISFIDINNDPYLSHRALMLLNSIQFKASESQQLRFLEMLQDGSKYFKLFFYVKQRLAVSKNYLIEKILRGAKDKYMANMQKFINTKKAAQVVDNVVLNDFKSQKVYMDSKYDLELKYRELQETWRQYEVNVLLQFLNQLCENCFKPAQIFLKEQIVDNETNFKDKNRGKICSIDLVYQVVVTFIDIVDILGDYVFSDFRTYKLIPLLLDTMIEFIYGPCIENQIFLGKWKKLIAVINSLISKQDNGNYSGIHQEAKSQLAILYSCSQVLLAIVDIKDPEKAKLTHEIVLNEIDLASLIKTMVDIFVYKIGGSPEKERIYKFNIQCKHYKDTEKGNDGGSHCIENEFCEHGFLIPRDKNTIQTGFNIYQILNILYKSFPNHPSLQIMKRDFNKYNYLWKDFDSYYRNVFKEISDSNTSQATALHLKKYNRAELRLLDQLIIKSFPEVYLQYLEKAAQENPRLKKSALLLQVIQVSRQQKTNFDQTKILEKVQEKIQRELEDEGHQDQEVLDTQADDVGGIESFNPLTAPQAGIVSKEELRTAGPIGLAKIVFKGYQNKISSERQKKQEEEKAMLMKPKPKTFDELSPEEKIIDTKLKRAEYELKLKLFKFYLASNFYDDNIGRVEVVQQDNTIIETTFKFPSFTQHLTMVTRKEIPGIIYQVSQQEKLEAFVGQIEMYRTEMLWQQKLGQIGKSLKFFANHWKMLSWVNFFFICVVNLLFIMFLEVNEEFGTAEFEEEWQDLFVSMVGYIQTAVAAIVVLSFYIEYRANFIFLISKSDSQMKGTIQNYGLNKGSKAFGDRKSLKFDIPIQESALWMKLRRSAQQNFLSKLLFGLLQELAYFLRAIQFSTDHFRNIVYLIVSMVGISNNFFTALLLFDIIFKIPQLTQVLRVFEENSIHLLAVLGLFGVVLYVSAFFAFNTFRDHYEHATEEEPNGPDFNMYCTDLVECLLSTANVGIRAGGGVGEALAQPMITDDTYYIRYSFDLIFFLVINIVLMNIFFGIIIDSFADKRALDNENKNEKEGMCFICGISKSQFDIENIPWRDHIYTQHNLHAYLSFILYVQAKSKAECTGVEKYVKEMLNAGSIEFFPVNRCMAIRGGEELAG